MKQVLIRQSRVVAEDVPMPQRGPGTALVRVQYSCISSGMEMSGIKRSGVPLWKCALARPADLTRLFKMPASEGVANTYRFMENKRSTVTPVGYLRLGLCRISGKGWTTCNLAIGVGIQAVGPI